MKTNILLACLYKKIKVKTNTLALQIFFSKEKNNKAHLLKLSFS